MATEKCTLLVIEKCTLWGSRRGGSGASGAGAPDGTGTGRSTGRCPGRHHLQLRRGHFPRTFLLPDRTRQCWWQVAHARGEKDWCAADSAGRSGFSLRTDQSSPDGKPALRVSPSARPSSPARLRLLERPARSARPRVPNGLWQSAAPLQQPGPGQRGTAGDLLPLLVPRSTPALRPTGRGRRLDREGAASLLRCLGLAQLKNSPAAENDCMIWTPARLSGNGEAEQRVRIVHRLYPDIHRA